MKLLRSMFLVVIITGSVCVGKQEEEGGDSVVQLEAKSSNGGEENKS